MMSDSGPWVPPARWEVLQQLMCTVFEVCSHFSCPFSSVQTLDRGHIGTTALHVLCLNATDCSHPVCLVAKPKARMTDEKSVDSVTAVVRDQAGTRCVCLYKHREDTCTVKMLKLPAFYFE